MVLDSAVKATDNFKKLTSTISRGFTSPAILLSLALAACTLPVTIPEDTEIKKETGAIAEVQKEDFTETLRKLNAKVLNSSGSVRFLENGILEIGKERAPILTVFTEYHSSYSGEFNRYFMPRLQEDFMNRNDLRVRFVNFPLKKYPNSEDIAKGLICAGKMEKGLQMHELLTLKQEEKRLTSIDYVEDLGVDPTEFEQCLESEDVQKILDNQKAIADELGVEVVPTFFLEGEKIVGLPYYPDLRGWIKDKL